MITQETKIQDLKLIKLETFEDFRGTYTETYNKNYFECVQKQTLEFVQDDVSVSRKNVLRGIHGDFKTWKLTQCVYGDIYSVIVDNRIDSPTYRKWQAFMLTGSNHYQLLIPPGCGNSTLTLSDVSVYQYKQTTYYTDCKQFTLLWNDPNFKIIWPISNPILSERDSYQESKI